MYGFVATARNPTTVGLRSEYSTPLHWWRPQWLGIRLLDAGNRGWTMFREERGAFSDELISWAHFGPGSQAFIPGKRNAPLEQSIWHMITETREFPDSALPPILHRGAKVFMRYYDVRCPIKSSSSKGLVYSLRPSFEIRASSGRRSTRNERAKWSGVA